MQISDIMAGLKRDPASEQKFIREVCATLRGTVRRRMSISHLLLIFAFGLFLCWMLTLMPPLINMLSIIVIGVGIGIDVLDHLSWELTFDGATGWMSYRSLFHEKIRFHVSEISRVQNLTVHFGRGGVRKRDLLVLHVGEDKITVTIRRYFFNPEKAIGNGDRNAGKLKQYLDLYESRMQLNTEPDAIPLSPAVAAAIAAEKAKEKPAAVPPQGSAPEPAPAPSASAEQMEPAKPEGSAKPPKTAVPEQTPIPPYSTLPERTDTFPDPARPVKKKDVDVDKLFNDVLQQYKKK